MWQNRAVNGKTDSWHLYHCAADLRLWVWPKGTVLPAVIIWLGREMEKRGRKKWGLLVHDAGTGQHLHLERRDATWKRAA